MCPICKEYSMVRKRRTLLERLRYAEIDECLRCECLQLQSRADQHPALSIVARCPRCGTPDLRMRRSLDDCDPLYRNPFSLIQRYLRGTLMYCVDCRLQFYDLRPYRKRRRA
jgi:ssDNA-binding Zn-finger/Zn-ribbon topoisomerase 1